MERRITIKITDRITEQTEAEDPETARENIYEQAERAEQKSHRQVADLWQEAAQRSN